MKQVEKLKQLLMAALNLLKRIKYMYMVCHYNLLPEAVEVSLVVDTEEEEMALDVVKY